MPITENQRQSAYRYRKKNIKRIPLEMQKTDYERLAAAAKDAGESINGYIKSAIADRMARGE